MTETRHPIERLVAMVEVEPITFCWAWTGAIDPNGYGVFTLEGRKIGAHVGAYLLLRGEVEEGLVLDHYVCQRRDCANPWHLEATTRGENTLRSETGITAKNARKTHCVRGHEFNEENTWVDPKTGKRRCRICQRLRNRQSAARRRATGSD